MVTSKPRQPQRRHASLSSPARLPSLLHSLPPLGLGTPLLFLLRPTRCPVRLTNRALQLVAPPHTAAGLFPPRRRRHHPPPRRERHNPPSGHRDHLPRHRLAVIGHQCPPRVLRGEAGELGRPRWATAATLTRRENGGSRAGCRRCCQRLASWPLESATRRYRPRPKAQATTATTARLPVAVVTVIRRRGSSRCGGPPSPLQRIGKSFRPPLSSRVQTLPVWRCLAEAGALAPGSDRHRLGNAVAPSAEPSAGRPAQLGEKASTKTRNRRRRRGRGRGTAWATHRGVCREKGARVVTVGRRRLGDSLSVLATRPSQRPVFVGRSADGVQYSSP